MDRFLCAGGVMAHYVGDACQPLHVSKLHDGSNAAEAGVHSAFETKMINTNKADILAGLNQRLQNFTAPASLADHRETARAVAELMASVFAILPPQEIIDAYMDNGKNVDGLWADVGDRAMDCMAAGCRTLATIWSSAWAVGQGTQAPTTARDQGDLKRLYLDKSFVTSMYLSDYVNVGIW
jgi:hypothetical protein